MTIQSNGDQNSGQQQGDGTQGQQQGKSAAQLEVERSVAVTEAINNHKAAEAARKEADAYKRVARNPQELVKMHSEDSALADKVAQELYGKPYSDLVAEAQEKANGGKKGENIDEVVNKAFEKRDRETARRELTKAEDKFFAEAKITPGSDLYKKIREEYTNYNPANPEAAKQTLDMIHGKYKKDANTGLDLGTTPGMSGSSASSGGSSSGNKKPQPTAAQRAIMPHLKITQADWDKHAKPRS